MAITTTRSAVYPNSASLTTIKAAATGHQLEGTLYICNHSATADSVRVAVMSTGSATNADYLLYDFSLGGNQSQSLTGIAFGNPYEISGYSANGTSSFVFMGLDKT